MGGGLMQLVAYGAQDIYLTGNPQITFFKTIYKRHTNFSMEHIQQTFQGNPGPDSRVVATVSRNGDLIHDCYIKFNCHLKVDHHVEGRVYNLGHALINNVELEIGGQLIDRQYGHFMEAHSELTENRYSNSYLTVHDQPETHFINASNSYYSPFQQTAGAGGIVFYRGTYHENFNLYVPLRFWFCRHIELALPLIALQYHEVNIKITFTEMYNSYRVNINKDPELWVNYIYLDTDERRRFAQVSHEYLIEQVQTQEFPLVKNVVNNLNLDFNHPVKELIWVMQRHSSVETGGKHQYGRWGSGGPDNSEANRFCVNANSDNYELIFNGHNRFSKQNVDYFTRYQTYKYHNHSNGKSYDSIGVYSFALKPESLQPSGTCNFSRIDSSILKFDGGASGKQQNSTRDPDTMFMYAINYNVLRIMSGMGGLAYSN